MSQEKKNKPLSKRRMARVRAMQALFQWHHNPGDLSELMTQVLQASDGVDKIYFERLLSGSVAAIDQSDEYLKPFLDRPISQLSDVELAILRLAIFELSDMPEVPYKVVINEAIELSKAYGGDGAHTYVNAVLDRAAPQLRALEYRSDD